MFKAFEERAYHAQMNKRLQASLWAVRSRTQPSSISPAREMYISAQATCEGSFGKSGTAICEWMLKAFADRTYHAQIWCINHFAVNDDHNGSYSLAVCIKPFHIPICGFYNSYRYFNRTGIWESRNGARPVQVR